MTARACELGKKKKTSYSLFLDAKEMVLLLFARKMMHIMFSIHHEHTNA